MLFRKSLIHEMSWVALAVFVVVLLLVMTTQIVRFLGQAAVGSLASGAVWAMMGFTSIRYLPTLLSLMLFAAVLSVMMRLWRDNEMVIWFASGRSVRDFVAPVLEFTLPIVALIAALALFVSPWAMKKGDEFRKESLSRQEITQVAPGVFRESGGSDRVYFVESFGEGASGSNVFVQMRREDKLSIILAQRGGLTLGPDGERWLWLGEGRAYSGVPGSAQFEVLTFDKANLLVSQNERAATSVSTRATQSHELWESDKLEHQAELAWRMALPVSALILSLAAVPLAFFNPRGGRAFNLVFAAFLYFFYYNCINLFQVWIATGRIPPWLGMWPLHGAALCLTLWLYRWRSRLRGVR
ncbi:LPS export ABC transporter permease LptF [Chitiniphilus purpureus]|uniref:Lipopolysaccharide export system permease protein LptF n=1 Tax=Chitiniphilus purpureus TaxID=2981137 RepID=A0ABY6DLA8_9NEIS|nr:LPS export ABC transporter permease LptF [Chitiniphilus sp. CD1]UXY15144.1 LPS export ABC transporter permease LptF [Chitiniphilus sp. CD1]